MPIQPWYEDNINKFNQVTNIVGTGIRAGVHCKLSNMSKHNRFEEILTKLRLQKRGTGGVDTAAEGGVSWFIISIGTN